jgi:hypothetical protein
VYFNEATGGACASPCMCAVIAAASGHWTWAESVCTLIVEVAQLSAWNAHRGHQRRPLLAECPQCVLT